MVNKPKSKFGKRKNFKRKFPAKAIRKNRKLSLYSAPMNLIGFPNTRTVKLRYVHTGSLTISSGITTQYVFSANSCYDPDQSGGGHQPYGFDQWSLFYNHYIVVGSKATVSVIPASTNTAVSSGIIHLLATDDSTSSLDSTLLIEQGKSKYRLLGVSSNVKSTTLSQTFSAKKFFNVSDVKDNVTRLGAPINNNPAEQAYFILKASSVTGTAQTIVYQYIMRIDYLVQFSEPKELPQS